MRLCFIFATLLIIEYITRVWSRPVYRPLTVGSPGLLLSVSTGALCASNVDRRGDHFTVRARGSKQLLEGTKRASLAAARALQSCLFIRTTLVRREIKYRLINSYSSGFVLIYWQESTYSKTYRR